MTKKEKEQIEQLKLLAAFHRTQPVTPDIEIPDNTSSQLKTGFAITGYRENVRVEPACSTAAFHGLGTQRETTTQKGIPLYSTKLLALKAARHQQELYCAKLLRLIDQQIEREADLTTENLNSK
jgi:hypothetical protein